MFRILNINFKEISFVIIFIRHFYESFVEWDISSTHLKSFKGYFCNIVPILEIWLLFIFVIFFHVFVISLSISMNSMAYSNSNVFSSISNILISVKRSHFTLASFKVALHVNFDAIRKLAVPSSHIQNTYFKNSQIYLLTITYWF